MNDINPADEVRSMKEDLSKAEENINNLEKLLEEVKVDMDQVRQHNINLSQALNRAIEQSESHRKHADAMAITLQHILRRRQNESART